MTSFFSTKTVLKEIQALHFGHCPNHEWIKMARSRIQKLERATPQTAATRARIIAVAERLFATRGIEAVTLNDITRAAGQKNKTATAYHFGDKEKLLNTILERHGSKFTARRTELLDSIERGKKPTLRGVVHALVQPIAAALFDPEGGREFILICAQTVAANTLRDLHEDEHTPSHTRRMRRALKSVTTHLPDDVVDQRLMVAATAVLHGLADHCRGLEGTRPPLSRARTNLFIKNLEDCVVGLLSAPASRETIEAANLLP